MDGVALLYTNAAAPLKPVEFVPARRPDKASLPRDVDIIRLNAGEPAQEDGEMPRPGAAAARRAKDGAANGAAELFRAEDVTPVWTVAKRAGVGLQNLGNTCFLNSVLQCLTHTPPLAEALLRLRLNHAPHRGLDALRLTKEHVAKALQGRISTLAPVSHVRSLKQLSRSFRAGRQEDAHEFLVALLDAMHEAELAPLRPRPPPAVAQTSMIFRIFAGRIRSQVKCCECGFESNTSDAFLDVSLEINRAGSVERALQRFTAAEALEGSNRYRCPQQRCLVRAAKRIAFEAAPAVLLLHLKRFEYSLYGEKITKKVEYGTRLDLGPYMAARRSGQQLYELYAVLVHTGHSVHSGHYYCFVRAPNGLWHQMDDSSVSQVSERVVLAQKAYMLFYMRTDLGRGQQQPQQQPAARQEQQQQQPQPPARSPPPAKRPAPSAAAEEQAASKRQRGSGGRSSRFAAMQADGGEVQQPAGGSAGASGPAKGMANGRAGGGAERAEQLSERRASHARAGPSRPEPAAAALPPRQPISPPDWMLGKASHGRAQGASPPPRPEPPPADFGSGRTPFSNGKAHARPATFSRQRGRLPAAGLLGKSHRKKELMIDIGLSRVSSRQLAGTPLPGSSPLRAAQQREPLPPELAPFARLGGGGENGRPQPQQEQEPLANGSARPASQSESEAEPRQQPEGQQPPARQPRSTTDAEQVRGVLGVQAAAGAVGPAGEAVWEDGGPAQQPHQAAHASHERESGRRRQPDAYDREYDRGKTKRMRGPRGSNAPWQDGNAFQRASDARRERGSGSSSARSGASFGSPGQRRSGGR